MRLGGLRDGAVYGLDGRRVVTAAADVAPVPSESHGCPGEVLPWDAFEAVGRLPAAPDQSLADRLLAGRGRPLVSALVGDVPTATVHHLGRTDWLATVSKEVFTSHDGGDSWHHRRTLAPSSGPSGVLPSAVCEHDGTVYLGEYPLGDDVPRLLTSTDAGRTWEAALELPSVRHVHAVQADPHGSDVWMTTGDADSECRIGRLRQTGSGLAFDPVGGGAQTWRAVELAFTPEAVLWGMDCGYASTNRLYRLDRDALTRSDPDPTLVGETDGSVYYAATLSVDGATWVAFATAVETGCDRTAPDRSHAGADVGRVLAASSRTNYTNWHEIARFERRNRPADWLPAPSANAYVYLASGPTGLFVNPYNTREASGKVLRFPPAYVEGLEDRR